MRNQRFAPTAALCSTLAFFAASGIALAQSGGTASQGGQSAYSAQTDQSGSGQMGQGGSSQASQASQSAQGSQQAGLSGTSPQSGQSGQMEQSQPQASAGGGQQQSWQTETDTSQQQGQTQQDQQQAAAGQTMDQQQQAGIQPVTDPQQLIELQGKKVVNQQGEEIGEIDSIVRDTTDQSLKAVVSSGGFLGMGGQKVAIPADKLQVQGQGDQIQVNTDLSQQELEQLAGAYQEENYEVQTSEPAPQG